MAEKLQLEVVTPDRLVMSDSVDIVMAMGTLGEFGILFAIPLIMICVVLASLVECFLVLPGHLRHALTAFERSPPSRFRLWFDSRFEAWRCGTFRRWVSRAVESRGATVSWALASPTPTP